MGKSSVGKSSILTRYIHGVFNVVMNPTVALDMSVKKVKVRDVEFLVQLWDTAGQERYRSIVQNFFNGAKAAILVFDIT